MQSPSSTIMAALVWHIKPNNLNFPAKFRKKKSFFEGKNFFFFFIWIIFVFFITKYLMNYKSSRKFEFSRQISEKS